MKAKNKIQPSKMTKFIKIASSIALVVFLICTHQYLNYYDRLDSITSISFILAIPLFIFFISAYVISFVDGITVIKEGSIVQKLKLFLLPSFIIIWIIFESIAPNDTCSGMAFDCVGSAFENLGFMINISFSLIFLICCTLPELIYLEILNKQNNKKISKKKIVIVSIIMLALVDFSVPLTSETTTICFDGRRNLLNGPVTEKDMKLSTIYDTGKCRERKYGIYFL